MFWVKWIILCLWCVDGKLGHISFDVALFNNNYIDYSSYVHPSLKFFTTKGINYVILYKNKAIIKQ